MLPCSLLTPGGRQWLPQPGSPPCSTLPSVGNDTAIPRCSLVGAATFVAVSRYETTPAVPPGTRWRLLACKARNGNAGAARSVLPPCGRSVAPQPALVVPGGDAETEATGGQRVPLAGVCPDRWLPRDGRQQASNHPMRQASRQLEASRVSAGPRSYSAADRRRKEDTNMGTEAGCLPS